MAYLGYAVKLNTPVVAVDHGLCLRKIANVIDNDLQSKLELDVA